MDVIPSNFSLEIWYEARDEFSRAYFSTGASTKENSKNHNIGPGFFDFFFFKETGPRLLTKGMLRVCQGEQSNFRIPGIPTINFQ